MFILSISEDILLFISGLGLFQGFLLATLIFFHSKSDKVVSKFLAFYITSLSIVMSGPLLLKVLGWKDSAFVAPFPALCGPFVYFYVKSFKETITWKKAWPHLILFFVYFVVIYWWVGDLDKRYPNSKDFPKEAFSSLVGIPYFGIRYVQQIIYYFLSRKELAHYQRSINQLFSETSRISLNWVKWLINGYILLVLISVIFYFLMTRFTQSFYLFYLINIAILTPYIYMATYKGITQPTIWQKQQKANKELESKIQEVEEITTQKLHKPGLPDKRISEIIAKVEALMETEKIYQEPELTLQDLADKIQSPSHQVSLAINEGMKKSFYDLVNGYRVEEAKRLLVDPKNKNYTILSIGFEAGFNSKTTFHTVFKKFTGLTPTEYRDKHKSISAEA